MELSSYHREQKSSFSVADFVATEAPQELNTFQVARSAAVSWSQPPLQTLSAPVMGSIASPNVCDYLLATSLDGSGAWK